MDWNTGRSTISKSSGKWYWEIYVDSGVGNVELFVGAATSAHSLGVILGSPTSNIGWSYYSSNGRKRNQGTATSYGSTWVAGDTASVALDMNNGKIWCAKNGTWQASGNPSTGANPMYSNLSGLTVFAAFTTYETTTVFTANFGASAFSYSVPSGFNAGLYA